MLCKRSFIFFVCAASSLTAAHHFLDEGVGSSSNPSPTDHIGTGYLGKELLKIPERSGFSLESLWILDDNQLLTGGKPGLKKNTASNLLQFELLFDSEKANAWKGGLFAFEVLRLDGTPTNTNAGLVQGFEGLVGAPPLSRTEFYSWWYRQELLEGRLIFRVDKSTPNCDFNAVNRLYPMNHKGFAPATSGLIYGTIFTQGSLAFFLPNYYNSAFGASLFYFPVKDFYIAAGGYDGNRGRGEQTGLKGPRFNGYYLFISETGYAWSSAYLPGRVAVGIWRQTGRLTLTTDNGEIVQNGAAGAYLYGSQRLWWKDKGCTNSGIVTFLQLGINNSKTTSINTFLGWGLTAFGLVPGRLKDSFGAGLSLAGLNQEPNSNEWMFQGYYQCCLYGSLYLEPVISYIPRPGGAIGLPSTYAATLRLLARF